MLLPVSPQAFHRIKLRGVGREKFQLQPAFGACDKLVDQPAAMTPQPIPDHQHLTLDVAQKMLQKLDHLRTADRALKQPEIKVFPGYSGHRRQMLPVKVILKNRGLPFGCPSPTAVRALAQSTLVDKHYRALFPLSFFLSLGQRCFFQRSIFCSSRSNARFPGLWQLQPSPCNSRQTWAGWYRIPHSCSIRSATREVVHNSVVYPRAWAPCLSLLSTLRRSVSLRSGFLPARPAFLSPVVPDSSRSFAQRLTDWRCTFTRRATSDWLSPWRMSRAAFIRRCSSATKSRRTPIGFPMHQTLAHDPSDVTIFCKHQ